MITIIISMIIQIITINYDGPTNQPTDDGHEGSLGSYTSIIVIIVRTSHILKACDIIGLVNATMTPIIL